MRKNRQGRGRVAPLPPPRPNLLNRHLQFGHENGWGTLLARVTRGAFRRVRDGFIARRLHAPGFRADASPRLYGQRHMRIGRNLHAGDHLWLDAITDYAGEPHHPQLILGDNIGLSRDVHIACLHRVEIGSGLLAGSHVLITDHTHGRYRPTGLPQTDPAVPPLDRPLHSAGPVLIGRNVWLGDNVVVLPGAVIGDGAVIGANAVVSGPISPGTIAVGAPARAIRRWDPAHQQWLPIATLDPMTPHPLAAERP